MPKIAYVGGFFSIFRSFTTPLKLFPQDCPQHFPQEFPARISRKIFLQEFPARFSRKILPQDFPTKISLKIFPLNFAELDPDWLAAHHPIPNAKFPPITALLNMPTYHKSAKVSPPPFPQISWEPQINEEADSKRASKNNKWVYQREIKFEICQGRCKLEIFSVLMGGWDIHSFPRDSGLLSNRLLSITEVFLKS